MIVHLNGKLVPVEDARVSVLDRGFIFGDGIYEGLRAVPCDPADRRWRGRDRRIVGAAQHWERMNAGLRAAGIGFDATTLDAASDALLKANAMQDAFVYWQITSGTPSLTAGHPPRHRVAPKGVSPTVFGYCTPQPAIDSLSTPPRKRAMVCRDIRWERGEVKSISLMGNVMAARLADEHGCDEAILIRHRDDDTTKSRGGIVSEGLATNVVLAFTRSGGGMEIVTPSLDSAPMLAGVTRRLLLDFAPEVTERAVYEDEIAAASEVMLVGTTTYVSAITEINGRSIGDGTPGPVACRLFAALLGGIREGRDWRE